MLAPRCGKYTQVQVDAAHSCVMHLSCARTHHHPPIMDNSPYLQVSSSFYKRKSPGIMLPPPYQTHTPQKPCKSSSSHESPHPGTHGRRLRTYDAPPNRQPRALQDHPSREPGTPPTESHQLPRRSALEARFPVGDSRTHALAGR
jgi:hypothetical protein